MNDFIKKVVMITGANSGIGRATAMMFAKEGLNVVLVARRAEEGFAVCEEIKSHGGTSMFIKADVTIESDVKCVVSTIKATYGRLDYAFNNAGIAEAPSGVTSLEESVWDNVLAVNLKGVWLCMKHQIPLMDETGGSSIVNMSSVYGLVGSGMGLPAYVASKHGVIGLTKAAALEYAQKNIRINAVAPGWIPTPANADGLSVPEIKDFAEQLHPMGRLGSQQEVAKAVLWLCSSQSSFSTGQVINVDGGYTAQ